MTDLDLYKFIKDNSIEYHWSSIENEEKVFMFIPIYFIEEFYQLIKSTYLFDEEGLSCNLMDGYFVFEMIDICSSFNIEYEKIFERD